MRPIAESMAELRRIAQSPAVQTVAEAFSNAGEEFALVGGPVRDVLLGRTVTDLDFTTSAHPDTTRSILQSVAQKTWDLGRDFGTIAARVQGEVVEVTTYRAEVYRHESRKPEVTFGSSIESDLVRRDFTMNSIALLIPEMKLVDVSHGIEDLLAGRIDTPGSPDTSFSDDPLRMLRAARFAAQLGFQVVDRVREAMSRLADRIDIVSFERIRDELVKLLNASDPVPGIRLLVDTGLAEKFLPELPALRLAQDDHKRHKDVYEHSLTVLQQAIDLETQRRTEEDAAPDTKLRLAALLHDIGKPATRRFENGAVTFHNHDLVGARIAKKRLRTLRFDNDTIKSVTRLIELHLRFFGYTDSSWTDSAVRRYARDAGDELERLHILTRSDVTTRNERKARRLARAYDDIERRLDELAEQEELDAVRPDLDGEQIMRLLELPPGPAVGAAYKYLLSVRLDEGPLGEAEAERRLRLWWAKQDPEALQPGRRGKKKT
jgi:poly(A) polymerase